MARFYITQRAGYWIINLCILLCNWNIITSQPCYSNATNNLLPKNWPCQWNDGIIPFVFNFYSLAGLKRLISQVKKGHRYLEDRSCLEFKEYNPAELAKRNNFTYLYYSYSGVLESCCLPFFTKPYGRRMVLITPICTLPAEVAHATLHGLGMTHIKHEPFSEYLAKNLLFFKDQCPDVNRKKERFNNEITSI